MLFIKLKFETGMTDFHKLIITILKVKPDTLLPTTIKYGDCKNFESKAFPGITNFR